MTDRITSQELFRMMSSAAIHVREQQACLSQLDCIAGDGDHGTTMLRIMDRLETAFTGNAAVDLKKSFCDAGWNVMACDGGASSSLLGAFFSGIGEATEPGITCWDCSQLATALEAGLQCVQCQTKARLGDKTLMDALLPAVEAFAAEARSGHDIGGALAAAAQAAIAGASATQDMVAHYGRARLLGERTKGHRDPGAASIALIFEGFSEAIAELKGDQADARC